MGAAGGCAVTTPPILEAFALTKHYSTPAGEVPAVRDVDLTVAPGSFAVVKGRSGSGKTTLLNLLGGLDRPTGGGVRIGGTDLGTLSEPELAATRRSEIGFIFQAFGLLPTLTAAENVELPMRLERADPAERIDRSRTLLELVGLGHRVDHRPAELSGGEQQRVAIARALANRPRLLLADEPTGQLDSRTGAEIVEVLAALVESHGVAAFVATHDAIPVAHADQVFTLSDGRLSLPGEPAAAQRPRIDR